MTVTRTKTELQGKLSEVLDEIATVYPQVATMTLEIVQCMILCETKKLKFSPENYDKIGDVEIKLSTDGDDVFVEIVGE